MSPLDPLAAKMRSDYEFLFGRLSNIDPPDGHCWFREIKPHEWAVPSLRAGVLFYGPRISLARLRLDLNAPDQMSVELRVSWNAAPQEPPGFTHVRAYVQCSIGPENGREPERVHLGPTGNLTAESALRLHTQIVLLIEPAIAAHRRRLARLHRPD